MTNKEAIDVINRECERTFLLLTCSNEFAHALERSINALEKMETVRAEVIEKVKKYIRLKTKYAEHPKEDYILAHDMYEWLVEQLKENK